MGILPHRAQGLALDLAVLDCIQTMAYVEAEYQDGVLRPMRQLRLQPGERVHIVVQRQPDAARWNFERLAKASDEDLDLASAGITDWAQALKDEDDR